MTPEEIKSKIAFREFRETDGDIVVFGSIDFGASLKISRHADRSEKHMEEIKDIIRAKILGAIFSDRRKELATALMEYCQYHFAVGDPAKVAETQDKLMAFVNYL